MKFAIAIIISAFVSSSLYAQKDTVQARIVVIGDAGSFHNGRHYVVSAVKKTIPLDEKTTVLYVGDNLYYTGLPDDALQTYDIRRQVLDSQMDIALDTKTKVYFIPGNHDWDKMQADGWEAIKREQLYIDTAGASKNVQFFPKDGCPGPVEVPINDDIIMILMDSQWWLHQYDKPGVESDCSAKTKGEVVAQVEDILSRNAGKLVLFADHHPFKSYGIHGGYYTWKQHIFPFTEIKPNLWIPLPILGSIYPITRGIFGTTQDLPSPPYQEMISDLQAVLKQYRNVIYVAGHEHNLQLIKDSSSYYVISGAGTNKTRVAKNKNLLYGKQQYGFMVLTVSTHKNVNFSYYTVYQDSVSKEYDSTLMNFSAGLKKETLDTIKSQLATDSNNVLNKKTVIAKIHPEYDSVYGFKRFFLGSNYRKEWAAPVQFPVFKLQKQNGGFVIESFNGEKTTASLTLKDAKGKEYVLRTVNKNPKYTLPDNLRNTVAADIVQDMISASQPYAALAIPGLANAVDVPEAEPTYYYVPDDPAFGIYRAKFANQVALLELREPTRYSENAITTSKLFNRLVENNDNHVMQDEVLNARLLDIFIGDFDRHYDQWKWGNRDTGKGKLYYPIPRDRDEAFFNSDGILLNLSSKFLLPFIDGFKYKVRNIENFNYIARDFDRFFLNSLDKNTWQQSVADFVKQENDSVITNAINKMPAEITAIDKDVIANKLKSRRQSLPAQAMKYYNFISKTVTIIGSNDKEYFHVYDVSNGLKVDVYKRKRKSLDTAALMYSRVFDPHVTKEIRMFGLNDDDLFQVDSSVHSHIRLRMIGGKGNDTFNIKGKIPNYIYDYVGYQDSGKKNNSTSNYITYPQNSKVRTSSDARVNEYSPSGFEYNINRFPNLNLGYNADDGVLAGIGFLRRTYGFRQDPYATEQKLSTLFALTDASYQLNYRGEFNHLFGSNDLVVTSSFIDPTLNYFYGLGNTTKIDASKPLDYYRIRYRYFETDALIRKRFNNVLHVSIGPVLDHYWNHQSDNNNRILGDPKQIGLDSADVYSQKTYVGGKMVIRVDNLDNVLLPTRGISWTTTLTSLAGLTKTSKAFTSLTSDMAVHGNITNDPSKLVFVMRVGGGHIYSNHYEYFQLLNLGSNNFLRGFRKDRFSGTSLAYGSLELRLKLFTSKSYLLPGDVGLLGFNDIGRVWLQGQNSELWHDAYGAGVYFAAFNYALLSATIGFSKEENIFNFSVGTKFNLTF